MSIVPDKLEVEVCAPERAPKRLEAAEVIVPGAEGVFSVLPGHTPLLSSLDVGVLIVYGVSGKEQFYAVNGGFAEVVHNKVLILTKTMEMSEEIDVKRATEARERAERRLKASDKDTDILRAEMALKRAIARLQTEKRISY